MGIVCTTDGRCRPSGALWVTTRWATVWASARFVPSSLRSGGAVCSSLLLATVRVGAFRRTLAPQRCGLGGFCRVGRAFTFCHGRMATASGVAVTVLDPVTVPPSVTVCPLSVRARLSHRDSPVTRGIDFGTCTTLASVGRALCPRTRSLGLASAIAATSAGATTQDIPCGTPSDLPVTTAVNAPASIPRCRVYATATASGVGSCAASLRA